MNHRFATDDDLDLLAEWNHQLRDDERSRNTMTLPQLRERMKNWLADDCTAVIFEQNGNPLAYALYTETDTEVYLRQFFVHRNHRRRGLGRAAIQTLRQHIWPSDKRLTVEALISDPPAIAFWRAVGYIDYSIMFEILPSQTD